MKIIQNPTFLQMAGNAGRLTNHFYITSRVDGNKLTFDNGLLGVFSDNVEYSVGSQENWERLSKETVITINEGQSVYFRNYTGVVNTNVRAVLFDITDEFDAGGNIMRLLYPGQSSVPANGMNALFRELHIISAADLELTAENVGAYAYSSMFYGCTGLTTAPELPATALAENCYSSMFYGCTGLTTAPELPATALAKNCYSSMFYGCTGLTTAPELPATALAVNCYFEMFYGCTGLTTAPELPATALAVYNCYGSMFQGCTGLTTAPELPATALAVNCYNSMFADCTGLTTAPELPATALAESCYSAMFYGCSSLTSITCLATEISADECVSDWLSGVADTGTFTKAADMEDWPDGDSGIPTGWTVEDYVA